MARPTDVKTSRISDGATLFEEAPTYDALGDITSETTTLPTGTDVQQFCYDEFSRLTWAGSTGTPPCTGTAITPGTLTGAAYTQSFSYDNQDRLRSSPLGSYSYDDPNHLHAATFVNIGGGTDDYSATYDASGNMLTRAPSESLPQQQLTWDNEGRLTSWQNAPSSPTSTAQYLYDGEGNRVEQQTTTGGTTTTTTYVGNLESVATTGSTTTTTTYYYAAGQRIALAVNGTLSYLASDLLGSATVALDGSGLPIASQLYAPYGSTRYQSGTMPTDYGFTGQRADSATGLDYYGARYYDPTLGQFSSADTVMDGLNRYGYVGGNPISNTDPSGQNAVLTPEEIGEIPGQTPPSVTSDVGDPSGGAGTGGGPPLPPSDASLSDETVLGGFDGIYVWLGAGLGLESLYTGNMPYDPDLSEVYNQRTAPKNSTPGITAVQDTQHTGGGGNGGGQPQGQPGSGEDTATPEPEPEPQPSTAGAMRGGGISCDDPEVLRLGACVHDYQMNTIGGRGRTYPCAGTCRIRGTLDVPFEMYQSTKTEGHAEWQTFWAVYGAISQGMEGGTLLIDYVIAYSPCRYCQESIPEMNQMLRHWAGPNVDITIRWWYLSPKGEVRPWPKTP